MKVLNTVSFMFSIFHDNEKLCEKEGLAFPLLNEVCQGAGLLASSAIRRSCWGERGCCCPL